MLLPYRTTLVADYWFVLEYICIYECRIFYVIFVTQHNSFRFCYFLITFFLFSVLFFSNSCIHLEFDFCLAKAAISLNWCYREYSPFYVHSFYFIFFCHLKSMLNYKWSRNANTFKISFDTLHKAQFHIHFVFVFTMCHNCCLSDIFTLFLSNTYFSLYINIYTGCLLLFILFTFFVCLRSTVFSNWRFCETNFASIDEIQMRSQTNTHTLWVQGTSNNEHNTLTQTFTFNIIVDAIEIRNGEKISTA